MDISIIYQPANFTDVVTLARSNKIVETVEARKENWGDTLFGSLRKEKRWKNYELRINPEETILSTMSKVHPFRMKMDVLEFILERRMGSIPVKINDQRLEVDNQTLLFSDSDPVDLERAILMQAKSITITITTGFPAGEYGTTARTLLGILTLIKIMRRSGHKRESTTIILEIYSGHPNGSPTLDRSRLARCAEELLKPFTRRSETTDTRAENPCTTCLSTQTDPSH